MGGETHSFVGKTYFEGDIRIEVPPEHFLQRIYDYDALLVMFPSMRQPGAYVLARRREQTAGLTGKALDMIAQPDTKLCIGMGWIPVCIIYKTGPSWDAEKIIAKLKARDIREQGGADKVADMLEEQEAADAAKLKAEIRDDQWMRSGDAWRSYQHRTGQSNLLSKGELPQRSEAAGSTASTPRSTSGLGVDQ